MFALLKVKDVIRKIPAARKRVQIELDNVPQEIQSNPILTCQKWSEVHCNFVSLNSSWSLPLFRVKRPKTIKRWSQQNIKLQVAWYTRKQNQHWIT